MSTIRITATLLAGLATIATGIVAVVGVPTAPQVATAVPACLLALTALILNTR